MSRRESMLTNSAHDKRVGIQAQALSHHVLPGCRVSRVDFKQEGRRTG